MTSAAIDPVWADVKTADVRGVKLAYRESGHGEPVVFVHGAISDLRTWAHQLTGLSDGYRAIALSRRYARPNDDIPADADDQLATHADDLAAVVQAIGAAPAHLVGNSSGAFICLLTAIRYPHLVRTLALEEPPVLPLFLGAGLRPRPWPTLGSLVRRPRGTLAVLRFGATTMRPAQQAFRRGESERAWRTFAVGVFGPDAFARLPEERLRQARENASAVRAELLGAGFPPLRPEDVTTVTVPVLLLQGADSPAFFGDLTDALAELLPQSERVVIPQATHLMHEQNPTMVNAALKTFLSAQEAATNADPS